MEPTAGQGGFSTCHTNRVARWSKTERHGDWGKAESIACQSGTVEGMRTNREGTRSFRAGLVWNPVSAGWGCASRTWGRRPRKPMGNVVCYGRDSQVDLERPRAV
jgi:hypothetical protein